MILQDLIKKRMKFFGINQRSLAEASELRESKLSIFLSDNYKLNSDSLYKILEVLELDMKGFQMRYELAEETAKKLRALEIEAEEIVGMSKERMSELCENPDILLLLDVQDKEELERMIDRKIVDYESTYPFFKTMVLEELGVSLLGEETEPRSGVLTGRDRLRVIGLKSLGRMKQLKEISKYVV